MPRSRNRLDGRQVSFEDESSDGVPVVFHGGSWTPSPMCESQISPRRFRLASFAGSTSTTEARGQRQAARPSRICHGGAGRGRRGVLDELSIERAHFVGMSWGGRLGFESANTPPNACCPSLSAVSSHMRWPDSPISGQPRARGGSSQGRRGRGRSAGSVLKTRFPDERRTRWVANDAAALKAAWTTALSEGPVAHDLRAWQAPASSSWERPITTPRAAQRAAKEVRTAEFLALGDANHYAAHTSPDELLFQRYLNRRVVGGL